MIRGLESCTRSGADCGSCPYVPTKKAVDMGLLVCVETTISSGGKTTLSISPKVTGKGQVYITQKFLSGEWKE